MRVPFSTIIHVEHLPDASRRRLRAILTHGDPLAPTAGSVRSRLGPVVVALVTAAAAAGIVARLADGPGPTAVMALVAAVAGAAMTAARAVARVRLWARLPFPPGCYVVGAYVVDATRELLAVTPIARTRPVVRRRLGRHTLVIGGDHPTRIALGPTAAAARALTWIHGDVIAHATALTAGDRTTAGHLDPLAEARDRDGVVIGTPGPPRPRRRTLGPVIAAVAAAAAMATPAAWWWVHRAPAPSSVPAAWVPR